MFLVKNKEGGKNPREFLTFLFPLFKNEDSDYVYLSLYVVSEKLWLIPVETKLQSQKGALQMMRCSDSLMG